MATAWNLSMFQGDTFSGRVTGKDDAGAAINLSGYSVTGVVKYRYGSTGILASLNASIFTGTNGVAYPSGLVDLTISYSVSTGLPIIDAVYDIQKYTSNNSEVATIIKGTFSINPQVT